MTENQMVLYETGPAQTLEQLPYGLFHYYWVGEESDDGHAIVDDVLLGLKTRHGCFTNWGALMSPGFITSLVIPVQTNWVCKEDL